MKNLKILFEIIFLIIHLINISKASNDKLIIVTVATNINNDGFARFNRSINVFNLENLQILGTNEKWQGGNVAKYPGGGQKIRLLKEYLNSQINDIDDDNRIILFTDSYDVIINSDSTEILKKFYSFNANIVFSSEKYCWPDQSLAKSYPKHDNDRYLNSGLFIGYLNDLYNMLNIEDNNVVNDNDDDQLYYTKIYLNKLYRKKFKIKLDLESKLFQNLNGEIDNIELRFTQESNLNENDANAYIFNTKFRTIPSIIHGNGNSKIILNSLGNYLGKSWHPKFGCLSCNENKITIINEQDNKPLILMAINIVKPTPFLKEFFEYIQQINYQKNRINILIQSMLMNDYHDNDIEEFIENYKNYYQQINYKKYNNENNKKEWQLRNNYIDECIRINCDYLFVVDSDARLTNTNVLIDLIEANRTIIAPLLVRPKEYWSNFWGTITDDGYYSRSHDYIQIIRNERRGIWNVPFISTVYLIKSFILNNDHVLNNEYFIPISYYDPNNQQKNQINDDEFDCDIYFCSILRKNQIFMFVTNERDYGHLSQMDLYNIQLKNADFYEIYTNEIEWRKRYIHENYTKLLSNDNEIIEQPCPDVYWFPIVTEKFCQHLIEIMENYGEWSTGKNNDPRLSGGYENVPTVDIHMNQVGLEQHWLYFLREYIRPIQEKVFIGYHHDPPKAIMNFVVRYHPNEQSFLRPHHDSSTYTVNIALNRVNIDYEGGGCRFVRQNCSLTNLRQGWSLIHPGRLTHYHEGLKVTKGIRYIMVSFVDP